MPDVLDRFAPRPASGSAAPSARPPPAQAGAWEAIAQGRHALVVAPTGSGKTLAAFLWAIDRLATPRPADADRHPRALHLAAEGARRRRGAQPPRPLVGVTQTAKRLGHEPPHDHASACARATPRRPTAGARRRDPPDILITTPESLFLMLTSPARETLATVETVIVDEVHAVAATKRGAHLALSLERLDALLEKPAQRIGLSATVRPAEEVARFLGGRSPVTIVAPKAQKTLRPSVVVPVEDMSDPDLGSGWPKDEAGPREGSAAGAVFDPDDPLPPRTGSIWPHVESAIIDLVLAAPVLDRVRELAAAGGAPHRAAERGVRGAARSARSRRRPRPPRSSRWWAPSPPRGTPAAVAMPAQSGSTRGASELLARAHHGSVEQGAARRHRGRPEVGAPALRRRHLEPRARHRHGRRRPRRAGRVAALGRERPAARRPRRPPGRRDQHAASSSPSIRPTSSTRRSPPTGWSRGEIESLRVPANPLDVLAQQTVAAVALDTDRRRGVVRRRAPQRAVRGAAPQRLRGGARPARRPLPLRRVRGAAPAHRLGPRRRHDHRAARAPSGSR